MQRFDLSIYLFLLIGSIVGCAHTSHVNSVHVSPPAPSLGIYPDSAAGLQNQFQDLATVAQSNDHAAFHAALDSLGIPDPNDWFAAHFAASDVAQLQQDYTKAVAGFQSHISWVMGNFARFSDFALKVEPSEIPDPPAEQGFESLLPRPTLSTKVENYRFTSTASDPKHGPPSWVSSFVYMEGRFRFVGGTYPFWAEGLTALRGAMSIPPAVIHGRIVQGAAFREDHIGPRITAIVQLRVEVGRDGRVNHIQVLSGNALFFQDAGDYVREAEFTALPDDPRLANVRRVWDIEVAFFSPKN